MNFAIKACALFVAVTWSIDIHGASIEQFVRTAALNNGLNSVKSSNPEFDEKLAKLGRVFFESKSMSLNGDIACKNCHLDKFGSADGIPNGIGVGGEGEGVERVLHGGAVLPRNTLPLWGRGTEQFKTFFWDGKVDGSEDQVISQFGNAPPSIDPLEVAIHLPVVEIREMLAEDKFISSTKNEDIDSAIVVYSKIISQLRRNHSDEFRNLAELLGKMESEIKYQDIATSVKHFFRDKFAIQSHRFAKFVFGDEKLDEIELSGAFLFYGKGKCAVCHSGSVFSDLSFYGVPLGQIGTGKNGFGVDYGRFNVTHDPNDLYKFRTPPLLDVENTAPYGHSGNIASIEKAITRHFDPLRDIDPSSISPHQRVELFKQIAAASPEVYLIPYLNDIEVKALVAFLKTLSFTPVDQ